MFTLIHTVGDIAGELAGLIRATYKFWHPHISLKWMASDLVHK